MSNRHNPIPQTKVRSRSSTVMDSGTMMTMERPSITTNKAQRFTTSNLKVKAKTMDKTMALIKPTLNTSLHKRLK